MAEQLKNPWYRVMSKWTGKREISRAHLSFTPSISMLMPVLTTFTVLLGAAPGPRRTEHPQVTSHLHPAVQATRP